MNNVHVILPDGVHDISKPSGGNAYDRRVCMGLARLGFAIWERMVPGNWPEPDEAALASLADVVSTIPDRTLLIIDGLIASAAAVPSSSNEALSVGRPVRSPITVWKLSSASRRPWLISGWYGV